MDWMECGNERHEDRFDVPEEVTKFKTTVVWAFGFGFLMYSTNT